MPVVIPEPITANGWTFYEKCKCNKILKWKFRNAAFPDYELQWYVTYLQFKIMNRNTTKVPLTRLALLDETLKNLN